MPQRAAVRRDAVPDGGRAHAGLRDHEPRQPRARLALHGRRLPGHRGLQPNRLVPGRGGVRARGHAGHRHAGGGDRAPHPLRARSPGPGPRHLRPDPLLQRGGGHRLGARGAVHRGAARAVRPPPGAAGHPVPRLPRGHHPGGPGRRPAAVRRGEPHPARHADPRRRQQPHDGGRAGREHPPALHGGLRPRRRVRRTRRRHGWPDLLGAAGPGRGDPHPGLRRHRHRRHRLDPRRAGGRGGRGHGGPARPGLPQADAEHRHRPLRRRQRGAGARLDADLHPDGGRALLSPPGAAPGRPQVMRSARALALVAGFLGLAISAWGADDGMRLARRSEFGGVVGLANAYGFYYVVFGMLVALLWLGHRLIHARFGVVIRAAKSNEPRMRAIGFATFRYKLAAFVIAGAGGGLAGALLTNQTEYLTPSYMHWTRSGDIMVMVILGGMGTLYGPVLGAVAFLLLEDILSAWTVHWQVVLGPLLVLVVLYARRGLYGLLPGAGARDG